MGHDRLRRLSPIQISWPSRSRTVAAPRHDRPGLQRGISFKLVAGSRHCERQQLAERAADRLSGGIAEQALRGRGPVRNSISRVGREDGVGDVVEEQPPVLPAVESGVDGRSASAGAVGY